jgi:hypothetical protein
LRERERSVARLAPRRPIRRGVRVFAREKISNGNFVSHRTFSPGHGYKDAWEARFIGVLSDFVKRRWRGCHVDRGGASFEQNKTTKKCLWIVLRTC